jgi:hypothetical protein
MNAFDIPSKSCMLVEKTGYPQLTYYHRAMAAGVHPRQLRRAGLPVIDRRFKAKNPAGSSHRAGPSNQSN